MDKDQYIDFLKKQNTEMLAIIMDKYRQEHPNATELEIAQEYRRHLNFISTAEDFANTTFANETTAKATNASKIQEDNIQRPIIIAASVAFFLLLSLLPMPYGYYTFLRFIVALFFGCQCYHAYKFGNIAGAAIPFLLTIIYNPLIPVYFDRDIWTVIDVLVAVFVLLQILSLYIHKKLSK